MAEIYRTGRSAGRVVGIALLLQLLILGCRQGGDEEVGASAPGLRFDALSSSATPSELEAFQARDGTALGVRRYEGAGDSSSVLVLVHGSGSESRYLAGLARQLSSAGAASVYTPDLRGHGPSPTRRGDIDYVDQLEDDLADLVQWIRDRHPGACVVVGGHSSGGGLALRFAASRHGEQADGLLLLAPFLAPDAPTTRENSGGWAYPKIPQIIAISILSGFGIHAFDDATVLEFAMPESSRDGNETLAYSYRMMTGFAPRDYAADLEATKVPIQVIVGSEDEAFHADRFEPTIRPHAPDAEIRVLAGATHLSLPSHPDLAPLLRQCDAP